MILRGVVLHLGYHDVPDRAPGYQLWSMVFFWYDCVK